MKTKKLFQTLPIALLLLLGVSSAKAQTDVANAAELTAALDAMQTSGGEIKLTGNITISPGANTTYYIASSAGQININAQGFKITVSGTGTTTDNAVLEIGNNVKITGTGTNIIDNTARGIIRIVGGEIESTGATANTRAVSAGAGWLYMTGGSVSITGTDASGNVAAINVENSMTAEISGGTISTSRANARTIRVAGATLKVSGSPTITATGATAHAIHVQTANGKAIIGGTPTISASGTANSYGVNSENAATYIVILSSVSNIAGNPSAVNRSAGSLVDLRGKSIVATPAAGAVVSGSSVTLSFSADPVSGTARPNLQIYYTTDGSDPTTSSTSVANGSAIPTPITAACTIKAVIREGTEYVNNTVHEFAYTIDEGGGEEGGGGTPDPTKLVSNQAELTQALTDLQTDGGDIKLTENIAITPTPGAANKYKIASTTGQININAQNFKITATGTGTLADDAIVEIGDNVKLYGTGALLDNANKGIIGIVGGAIESTGATSGTYVVNDTAGWLYMTGGSVSITGTDASGYGAAINVDKGSVAEISGGTISTNRAAARTIRVSQTGNNFGILKLSGNPVITALGNNAHALLTQNGGKALIDGSPTIQAKGTGTSYCIDINGNGAAEYNTSYVAVLQTATPTLGGSGVGDTIKLENTANSAFIDLRGAALAASEPSGTQFDKATEVAFTVSGAAVKGKAAVLGTFYTTTGTTPTTASPFVPNGSKVPVGDAVTYTAAIGVSIYVDAASQATFAYTVAVPDPTKYVATMAELTQALTDLKTTGGDIVLLNSIVVEPGAGNIYNIPLAGTAHKININMGEYKITAKGTGTLSDNAVLAIGDSVKLYGTNNIIATQDDGIVQITGGEIESKPVEGNGSVYAVNINNGKLLMSGGSIVLDADYAGSNPAAINVDNGKIAEISGGTVSILNKPGARTIRVNGGGILKVSGSPIITALGDGVHAILAQAGGTATIDGTPTITASGTGTCNGINTTGNNSYVYVLETAGALAVSGTANAAVAAANNAVFIDFRGIGISATPASGILPMPTAVLFALSSSTSGWLGANNVKLYYTTGASGGTPTTASSALTSGNTLFIGADTVINMIFGAPGYLSTSVETFTYTVTPSTVPITLISNFAELQQAFADLETVTSSDTTLWALTANIAVVDGTTASLIAHKPVKLNTNGYYLLQYPNAGADIDITFGGDIAVTSLLPTKHLFFPVGTTTHLTINGGVYNTTGNTYLFNISAGFGVNDAGTSWTIKNATINNAGAEAAKGVVNFGTSNGKLLVVDSCTINVEGNSGNVFHLHGPAETRVSNTTVNSTNATATSAIFRQSGGSATGPNLATLVIDSLYVDANDGALVKWTEAAVAGKTAVGLIRSIRLANALPLLDSVAGQSANKLYDLSAYSLAASVPTGTLPTPFSVTLECVSTNAALALPSIVYTLDGEAPTVGSTVYWAPIAINQSVALKAALAISEFSMLASETKTYNYTIDNPIYTLTIEVRDTNNVLIASPNFTVTLTGDLNEQRTTLAGTAAIDLPLGSSVNVAVSANGYEVSAPQSITAIAQNSTLTFVAAAIVPIVPPVTHTVTVEVRDKNDALITSPNFTVTVTGTISEVYTTAAGIASFQLSPGNSVQVAVSASNYTVLPSSQNVIAIAEDKTLTFVAEALALAVAQQAAPLTAYLAHDVLYVSQEVKTVKIVNTMGAVMLDATVNGQPVGIAGLPTGIYFVQLFDGKNYSTTKVVKK